MRGVQVNHRAPRRPSCSCSSLDTRAQRTAPSRAAMACPLLCLLLLAPQALAWPAPHPPHGAREDRGVPGPWGGAAFFADIEYADDGSEDQDKSGEEPTELLESVNSANQTNYHIEDNPASIPVKENVGIQLQKGGSSDSTPEDFNKPREGPLGPKISGSRIQHIPKRSKSVLMDPSKPIVVPDIFAGVFGSSEDKHSVQNQRRSLRLSSPHGSIQGFDQGLRPSREQFYGSQFISPGQDVSSQLGPVIQNIVDRHLDSTVQHNLAAHVQAQVHNVFQQTAHALCPNCPPQQFIPTGGIHRQQPFVPVVGFGQNYPFGGLHHNSFISNTGDFNHYPFGNSGGITYQNTFAGINDQVHVGPPKVIKVSQSHYQIICSGDNQSCQKIPVLPQNFNQGSSPEPEPLSPKPEHQSPEPNPNSDETETSSPNDDITIPNGGSEEEEINQQTDANTDVIFSNSPKPDETSGKEIPDIDVRLGSDKTKPKRSVKDDVTKVTLVGKSPFDSKNRELKNEKKTYSHEYIEVGKTKV